MNRKTIVKIMALALLVAGTCGWSAGQSAQPPAKEEAPDRAVVPLSNPAQPAKIEVAVMRGSITIKGYQGKEVIVEARTRERALSGLSGRYVPYAPPAAMATAPMPPAHPAPAPLPAPNVAEKLAEAQKEMQANLNKQVAEQEALAKRIAREYDRAGEYFGQYFPNDQKAREEKEKKIAGMKRLSGSSSGLEVEEEDNVVTINTQSWKAATDLDIQVPAASSLEIRSSMDGAVVIEGVSGEIDVNNIAGPVTLTNVSGNTLVHTVGGDVTVVMSRVASGKPMSFSTMNGDIDVTLPADVKADLKMKTDQGEIYTDFDITVSRKATRSEESEKTEAGKYRITFDKSLVGLVNGGGPEISFNTFSGDIYIRKKK